VQQAIGQIQNVAGQVGDLKRLFSYHTAAGVKGEAHIQPLLDDVLPVGAYEANECRSRVYE
jgi:DNA recombination protein RmuC